MTKKQVLSLLEKMLDEKLKGVKSFNDNTLFVGYNPIEKIRGGLFHWIAVPFNGIDYWCELRCPNATQLEQCGDISNIVIEEGKIEKISYDDKIKIRNYQEELCKLVLNRPIFDHIASLVGKNDMVISEFKKELEIVKVNFEEHENDLSIKEKEIIETRIRTLELKVGFILPDDTMAFLTKWAMGNDVSDIKRITKESFIRAAALAKAHNKAPSDYLSGVFTDYNKQEIDGYAFKVLEEYIEMQKVINSGKYQWFLGGRKNTAALPKRPKG
jgi:hypothetical protein